MSSFYLEKWVLIMVIQSGIESLFFVNAYFW